MAKINWQFDPDEIENIHSIIDEFEENLFVERRARRNVQLSKPEISKPRFWQALLVALLTSQQRSGPDSAVSDFLINKSHKIDLEQCRNMSDVQNNVANILENNGGIRRYNNIGEACEKNLKIIEDEEQWNQIKTKLNELGRMREREPRSEDAQTERSTCKFLYEEVDNNGLLQIGPKQSRNLLQAMGLTRYEIPMDSRITKWLNKNMNFPYKLTAGGLSQAAFYDFNLDLIQAACQEAEVLPCIFDACVFTSFSPDWPEEAAGNNLF